MKTSSSYLQKIIQKEFIFQLSMQKTTSENLNHPEIFQIKILLKELKILNQIQEAEINSPFL